MSTLLWVIAVALPFAVTALAYPLMKPREERPARPAVRPEPDPHAPLHPSWLAPCDDQPDTRPDLPAITRRAA